MKRVEMDLHGRRLSIESRRMAKQANGSAFVQYGDTVVLVTAVAAREPRESIDFFPLTVDYQEKTFAAGNSKAFEKNAAPTKPGVPISAALTSIQRQAP